MALLRRLSYELILSLTSTSVRLLHRAIGEYCGLYLALLGWIDRDRLLTDLARVAIDEALESWRTEQEGSKGLGSLPGCLSSGSIPALLP